MYCHLQLRVLASKRGLQTYFAQTMTSWLLAQQHVVLLLALQSHRALRAACQAFCTCNADVAVAVHTARALACDQHWSGCVQVWLLYFGHSTMSSDAAAQAEELEQLLRLFRRPDDSAASRGWLPVSGSLLNQ